ncbi:MAG TPA: hypothetical protein VIT38_02100 [Allosphingosinicella sp.]
MTDSPRAPAMKVLEPAAKGDLRALRDRRHRLRLRPPSAEARLGQ